MRTWLPGALALLLFSQTGCIVSVLAGRFFGDEDEAAEEADDPVECLSERWSFEGSPAFDSKSACDEQADESQTCVCEAAVSPDPAR